MSTEMQTVEKKSLVAKFADKYHIEPSKMLDILKATAFRQRRDNIIITNEQMAALLIVADNYKLNPFTKEIFAFEDKGAIVPVVSVDGWSRIINEHPAFNGLEFNYSDNIVTMTSGKPCPEWCEVVIYRKDRDRPTIVREYLDEVYQPPRGEKGFFGPWQTHTKRFLRHKTLIQGARIAFGFAGIYDEDEASRIVEAQAVVVQQAPAQPAAPVIAAPGKSSRLSAIVGSGIVDAPIVEAKAEPVAVAAAAADDDLPWHDEAGAA